MRIEILTSLEQIDALRESWEELFARSGSDNYFVSYRWIRACVARLAPRGQARIYVVMDGEQLVALAPLLMNGKTFTFLMIPDLADYCEILCEPLNVKAVARLVRHVLAQRDWTRVHLAGIPAHARCLEALANTLDEARTPWHRQTVCVSPLVRLDGTYDSFNKSLTKKVRQEVRTTQNHLDRLGSWSIHEANQGAEALRIYDRLVEMHLGRQAGKVGSSLFEKHDIRDFLRALIPSDDRGPPPLMGPVLSALVVQQRVVAAAYSLSCKATFFYWIPSFDAALKSMSLGKVLISRLIEKRYEEGRKIFDFMGGNEPYKYQWSDDEYEVVAISIFRHRSSLALFRTRLWAIEQLKRLMRALPALRNLRVILSKFR